MKKEKNSKRMIVIAIIAVWFIILFAFIAYKESALMNGNRVLLKTQPVDPRDLFRGDYVILNYEISDIDTDEISVDQALLDELEDGDRVYVQLEKGEKYWHAVGISDSRPEGTYILGMVDYYYNDRISLEYGIESYFVPEGRGKELERSRNAEHMDVEVAIDKFGIPLIANLLVNGTVWEP